MSGWVGEGGWLVDRMEFGWASDERRRRGKKMMKV